jgi:hypothetical protein
VRNQQRRKTHPRKIILTVEQPEQMTEMVTRVELSDTPSLPDQTVPAASIQGKADTAKILPFQRPARRRHTRYTYPDTDAVDKILDIVVVAEAIILGCLLIWHLKKVSKS